MNKKGLSPVVSTVILVAVTITVAVAVAYWVGGLASYYTQFESIDWQNINSVKNNNFWKISLTIKNNGIKQIIFTSIFINNQIIENWEYRDSFLNIGELKTLYVIFPQIFNNQTYSSGMTVAVRIHTANGNDYIKMVTLN